MTNFDLKLLYENRLYRHQGETDAQFRKRINEHLANVPDGRTAFWVLILSTIITLAAVGLVIYFGYL